MSGFQFPPPPPPPPRTSTSSSDAYRGQHASQERSRGRARGRGYHNSRGRGDLTGSYHQYSGNNYAVNGTTSTAANRNSNFNDLFGAFSAPDSSSRPPNRTFNQLPPGSHVNPSFVGGFNQLNSSQPAHGNHTAAAPLSRNAAGHKRKLEALRGPQQEWKKPDPPTAPSVPSFGTGVLPDRMNQTSSSPPSKSKGSTSRSSSKILGLTPHVDDPQYSSSDSDENANDVDEEAMHAEMGTTLTFEHNGMVMSLNSAADLATWVNERRKNWPTRDRMTAKLQEKRKTGEMRRKLISDAISVLNSPSLRDSVQARQRDGSGADHAAPAQTSQHSSSSVTRNSKTTSRPRNGLAETTMNQHVVNPAPDADVERETCETEPASEVSTENVDKIRVQKDSLPSPRVQGPDTSHDVDDVSASMSAAAASEESAESSDDSNDSEPPEEQQSKPSEGTHQPQRRVCRYFSASGYCRDGESCRFKHENPPPDAKPASVPPQRQGKQRPVPGPQIESGSGQATPSIYSLLVEREQDDEDVLALQMIKFLGKSGFFSRAE